MQKIVGFVGSLRKDSINRTVFETYKDIHKDEFEMIEAEIADIPLYNGDDDEPDSVTKMADLVKNSDGVIFFGRVDYYRCRRCWRRD